MGWEGGYVYGRPKFAWALTVYEHFAWGGEYEDLDVLVVWEARCRRDVVESVISIALKILMVIIGQVFLFDELKN